MTTMNLTPNHAAILEERSIHQKRIFDPVSYTGKLLKSVANNKKLGNGSNVITKGKWSSFPMFSLTLEERKTCPNNCHHYRDCYGNGMAFAHRFKHGKDLEARVWSELEELSNEHKRGFVIRLHVLGDFYSKDYVSFWINALRNFRNLSIFGYTARKDCDIGNAILGMNQAFPIRSRIRQSHKDTSISFVAVEIPNKDSITCPEQTGKTSSCINCSLCWESNRPIHFLNH